MFIRAQWGRYVILFLYYDLVRNEFWFICITIGKSTTISMLTGMSSITAGSIDIFGWNIKYDLDKIRKIIGVW
jgi:ABC-type proline/glycine betaine transport system ATPase subunit